MKSIVSFQFKESTPKRKHQKYMLPMLCFGYPLLICFGYCYALVKVMLRLKLTRITVTVPGCVHWLSR